MLTDCVVRRGDLSRQRRGPRSHGGHPRAMGAVVYSPLVGLSQAAPGRRVSWPTLSLVRLDGTSHAAIVARRSAGAPRQSARHLRPGRRAAAGQHRPHQRLRLGSAHRHSATRGACSRRSAPSGSTGWASPTTCSPPTSTRSTCPRASTGAPLAGRSMLVRKTEVVPIECVVRGYLVGLGLEGISDDAKRLRHQAARRAAAKATSCPSRSSRRPPRPRADTTRTSPSSRWSTSVGREVSEELRRRSLAVYRARRRARPQRGIIIADTKFEWGRLGDEMILIDEVLTPDSSRFWPADEYAPGATAAVVRQAVRPRLAGDDRLGQEQPAAASCRRRSPRRPAPSTSRHSSG